MPRSGPPRSVTLQPKAPPALLWRAGMTVRGVWPVNAGRLALFEDQITVRDRTGESTTLPRRYTLAHDAGSPAVWLSISAECEGRARSGPAAGERSEVLLAELVDGNPPCLRVQRCAESSETARGSVSRLRGRSFEDRLPFLLAAIRYGDRFFFEQHPEWDQARVVVDGRSTESRCHREQGYGRVTDYRVTAIAGESRRLAFGAAALAAVSIGALFLLTRRKQDGGG